TVEGLLAHAVLVQGRLDEAALHSEVSARLSSTADAAAQVGWRVTRARVDALRGALAGARAIADEAVALASATDSPTLQGDAFRCRADVLLAEGMSDEAVAALAAAAAAYERKGHLVGARLAAVPLGQRDAGAGPSRAATLSSTAGDAEGGT